MVSINKTTLNEARGRKQSKVSVLHVLVFVAVAVAAVLFWQSRSGRKPIGTGLRQGVSVKEVEPAEPVQEDPADISIVEAEADASPDVDENNEETAKEPEEPKRKPIFFHHIPPSYDSPIPGFAEANEQLKANMRWADSACEKLTACKEDVTFVRFEHSLGTLDSDEWNILFPEKGKGGFLSFVQVQDPLYLEREWFLEQKYGIKVPEMANVTFAEYILPSWKKSNTKRMNTLLMWLGGSKDYGALVDIPEALKAAKRKIDLFDVVTLSENAENTHPLYEKVFGWKDFSHVNHPPKFDHQDLRLSYSETKLLMKILEADYEFYLYACEKARETWTKWGVEGGKPPSCEGLVPQLPAEG